MRSEGRHPRLQCRRHVVHRTLRGHAARCLRNAVSTTFTITSDSARRSVRKSPVAAEAASFSSVSMSGQSPSPNMLAYGVAKAGVSHMALSLADEMAGEKIRVNCVAPAWSGPTLPRPFGAMPRPSNRKARCRSASRGHWRRSPVSSGTDPLAMVRYRFDGRALRQRAWEAWVRTRPGATQLTRTSRRAISSARLSAMCDTPAFAPIGQHVREATDRTWNR